MMGRKEKRRHASETNEWKTRWLERKERRRRMTTLANKIERACESATIPGWFW